MSRMVVGSNPFSRKSLRAEVRMFSRVASRLEIFAVMVMFERVQNITVNAAEVNTIYRGGHERSTGAKCRSLDSRSLRSHSLGMTFGTKGAGPNTVGCLLLPA